MFNKLAQTSFAAALALFANQVNAVDFVEIMSGDSPEELLNKHEFSVVSFFDSSPESLAVHGYVEASKIFLEAQIASGEWTDRNIGWFKIDLEKYPDLNTSEGGRPDQMITGGGW